MAHRLDNTSPYKLSVPGLVDAGVSEEGSQEGVVAGTLDSYSQALELDSDSWLSWAPGFGNCHEVSCMPDLDP